jgi:hypothetical protein
MVSRANTYLESKTCIVSLSGMLANVSTGVAQQLITVELGVSPLLGLAPAATLHLQSYGRLLPHGLAPLWSSVSRSLLLYLLQHQQRRFLPMRHAEGRWDTLAKDQISAAAAALAGGVVPPLCKVSFNL